MALKGKLFIFVGIVCLVAAAGLVTYNVWDDNRAQTDSRVALDVLEDRIAANKAAFSDKENLPNYVLAPYMEMPTETIGGYDYIGYIAMSTIDIELPVMSEFSYDRLSIAPCRYAGSAYLKNMVLAGHDYYSHFGKIANLSMGDEVIFTDVVGNVFTYQVNNIETLGAYDSEAMKESDADLTLFTCTLDGNRRITVRCAEISNKSSEQAFIMK